LARYLGILQPLLTDSLDSVLKLLTDSAADIDYQVVSYLSVANLRIVIIIGCVVDTVG